MAFGKYWLQLFLFCCGNTMSHDIFLLNRSLCLYSIANHRHSVVWICRTDSCKTQSLCPFMSDFIFPLTPVTTFTDSTYQWALYNICLCLADLLCLSGSPLLLHVAGFSSFRVVQLLSHVLLLVTPWTAAHQASLSFPISELAQTHIHWVSNVIQPSHPLSSPSPPACNLSQHQGLFQWVGSSHQVCQSIGTSPSVLPMNIWSPYCPRDSQESSPAPQFKSIILGKGRPDYYSDRYLSCFPMLVIQNNTSVNMEVQISFWISVFISLDKYPYDGLLDHIVDLLLFFLLL